MSLRDLWGSENSIWVEILVFALGGCAYGLMEMLFRGYTHWSMVMTGGACILTFFTLQAWLLSLPLWLGASIGAAIITVYEFCVGYIVNVRLGWQVWDYSAMAGNVMGQICPAFTLAWFGLSFAFLGLLRVLTTS